MARATFLIALWLLAAAGGVAAELRASVPAVRRDVVGVIEAQLAAFRAGDVAGAFGQASAALRAQIPLRAFAAMIRGSYAEIWSSERAEFGLVRDDGTRASVRVHVWAAGRRAAFDYGLVREAGGWRVGSVVRHVPVPGEGL